MTAPVDFAVKAAAAAPRPRRPSAAARSDTTPQFCHCEPGYVKQRQLDVPDVAHGGLTRVASGATLLAKWFSVGSVLVNQNQAADARFSQGIEYFNAGAFFDAHEVWEDLWHDCHDDSRTFYKGLIQIAVCLHHFRNRNTRGAQRLCRSASAYVAPYQPIFRGLNVERLLRDLQRCCAEILADPDPTPRGTLNPDLIPTIHLIDITSS